MTENYASFCEELKGRSVAFIGAGVTNRELIPQFVRFGAQVTLCDKKSKEDLGALGAEYEKIGVRFSLGEGYLEGLKGQSLIMRSPGFEFYTPQLQAAAAAGSEISSEMEMFFRFCPCEIYAVTGSDGKTTSTTLIAEMLKAQGFTVHLGGNIGRALLPIIGEIKPTDIAVVELSSFQLISMRQSPDVAVVTNVTPNHLDHHKDMQEYIDAKRNILLFQTPPCKTVLGYENEISRAMQADARGDVRFFTRKTQLDEGAFLSPEGDLCLRTGGETTVVLNKSEVKLRGEHNIENLLCAMATVEGAVSAENMRKVAASFTGVEHRIEPVPTKHPALWYNDSIGTSPTRTIAGLLSFPQKVILIAGGYDKGIPYEPLVPYIVGHVKTVILAGATGVKIENALKASDEYNGTPPLYDAKTVEGAVALAAKMAGEGDIVLFSPASASFDAYPNFEKRGEHFKDLVAKL